MYYQRLEEKNALTVDGLLTKQRDKKNIYKESVIDPNTMQ